MACEAQDPREGLLRTLYAAPMRPELWDAVLAGLCRAVNLCKAALISHELSKNQHRMFATFGETTRESIHSYEQHFWQFDEWTKRFGIRVPCGRFALGEEVWPRDLMLKSVFFNEFLKPFDTCQVACTAIGANNTFDAVSLYRGPREEQIEDERRAILESFLPHLTTALSLRRRLSELESRVSDMESALDRLSSAVVLLDASAKPILLNRAARLILDAGDGLLLSRNGLLSQTPSEHQQLRAIIAKTAIAGSRTGRMQSGSLLITRSAKRPLHLLVVPLLPDGAMEARDAVVMVLIQDPDASPRLPSEVLRELYGLTQAESRLARSLLEGHSLSDVASLNNVSHETVRSQIKSVLHKTGTRSQGQLIRLLSFVPGPHV